MTCSHQNSVYSPSSKSVLGFAVSLFSDTSLRSFSKGFEAMSTFLNSSGRILPVIFGALVCQTEARSFSPEFQRSICTMLTPKLKRCPDAQAPSSCIELPFGLTVALLSYLTQDRYAPNFAPQSPFPRTASAVSASVKTNDSDWYPSSYVYCR